MYSKKNKPKQFDLALFIQKWGAPIAMLLVTGFLSWAFFSRLDKVETLIPVVSRLEAITNELDKGVSSSVQDKALTQIDINTLKLQVQALQIRLDYLEKH
jgi:hypothetical protein